VLVAILAAAFNLRIGIVAVGPLIEDIRADTGMPSAVAGALTTIPFLCMGAFAFLGPPLVRRYGNRTVVLGSLGLITAGTLLRAAVPSAPLVVAATLPIGLGIALIGVSLPAVVKERFPGRGGLVTGAYVASLSVGLVMVGFGLVPLADELGGWRGAFALSAVPGAIAAVLWLSTGDLRSADARAWVGTDGDYDPLAAEATLVRLRRHITPDRMSLLLGLSFGLQSACFAGMVSWGPAVYQDAGWSESGSAIVTSSIGIFTIIASLTLPPASEGRDRRGWVTATAFVMAAGVLGVALAPTDAPWLWLTMFGLASGGVFALLLALPLDLAQDPGRVAALSAWMLGLGYLLASLAPVVIGALRDITGDFVLPMLLLGCCGIASGVLAGLVPGVGPETRPRTLT
jgi:CP family cyanate transporter-like MFS transporter